MNTLKFYELSEGFCSEILDCSPKGINLDEIFGFAMRTGDIVQSGRGYLVNFNEFFAQIGHKRRLHKMLQKSAYSLGNMAKKLRGSLQKTLKY